MKTFTPTPEQLKEKRYKERKEFEGKNEKAAESMEKQANGTVQIKLSKFTWNFPPMREEYEWFDTAHIRTTTPLNVETWRKVLKFL